MDRTHAVCPTNGEIGRRAARSCTALRMQGLGARHMLPPRACCLLLKADQKPNMLLRIARASAVACSSAETVRTATLDFNTFAATESVSEPRTTVKP